MGEALKLKVWEALAAVGATPIKAMLLMESQRVLVTAAEAEEQLTLARERNTLRLVKAGELPRNAADRAALVLRSRWNVRIKP